MENLFRNFELNRLSFWIGFLTATLFWWLLKFLRPRSVRLIQSFRERIASLKIDINAKIEVNLRNSILRQAENLHLATPLFSLSEIIVPPKLLAPPQRIQPGDPSPTLDISEHVLPYTPDYPEMAATYGWPKLTLADALTGGANLIVTGLPGGGKTVTLAHLAIEIVTGKPLPGNINQLVPLLVHVCDLLVILDETDDSKSPLVEILTQSIVGFKKEHLITYIEKIIEKNRLLLLIDGLDELHPEQYSIISDYLKRLLKDHHSIRVVVTASANFIDGLTTLGFIPISMAAWDDRQRTQFINRWSDLWIKYIGTNKEDSELIDPVLLNAWLYNDKSNQTPLELTLKVWATYAGDTLGPSSNDAIEAYIRRMIADVSSSRRGLEMIAINSLVSAQPIFSPTDVDNWISLKDRIDQEHLDSEQGDSRSSTELIKTQKKTGKIGAPDLVLNMVEVGVFKKHLNSTLSFSNPIIHSFLASCIDSAQIYLETLFNNANWVTVSNMIGYLAARYQFSNNITDFIDKSKDPLQEELLIAARWLRDSNENVGWYGTIMRRLADILSDETLPLALRGRALSALSISRGKGINVLFKKLITSDDAIARQLAALGMGQIQDVKAISSLISMLNDPVPNIRRAACLALVAIGNSTSLEAVAEALLRADDDLRRMAAEALSNNYEEGYPTLKEGADLDDLLVRRSVVYGLQRINASWSNKILEKLQLQDEQWVVKTAATQALEELALPNKHIPQTLPPLTETPWLISFASEHGIGVAPGKPARNLLLLALREGNEEQQFAALYYLSLMGDSETNSEVYKIYTKSQGELREAAFNTLWQQATAGNIIQAA